MNWFNILKNQIASTKGKTFQLDFNQPMIEEEECKEKLRAVLKQVESINSIEGFDKIIDKKTVQRHRKVFQSKEDKKFRVRIRTSDRYSKGNYEGFYFVKINCTYRIEDDRNRDSVKETIELCEELTKEYVKL